MRGIIRKLLTEEAPTFNFFLNIQFPGWLKSLTHSITIHIHAYDKHVEDKYKYHFINIFFEYCMFLAANTFDGTGTEIFGGTEIFKMYNFNTVTIQSLTFRVVT